MKYSENAKRRLDELKMAQEKVREDLKLIEQQIEIKRQRKERLELEKSIQKHRAKAEAADKAAAANVIWIPFSCPLKPTSHLYLDFNVSIHLKLALKSSVG